MKRACAWRSSRKQIEKAKRETFWAPGKKPRFEQVPLRSLYVIPAVSLSGHRKYIRELMDAMCSGPLPPAVVEEPGGKAALILRDGHHRANAARRLGHKTIPAIVWRP